MDILLYLKYLIVLLNILLGKSNTKNPNPNLNDNTLFFTLSADDKKYINDDLKDKIITYIKFIIEEEKKKKN